MKHGHSCDIQIWWPSVENIAPGLRSRGTFSTSVHHIWMSHSLLCIICIMLCCIFIIFSDSNFVSVAIWWKTQFSKIGFRCSQNCYLMDNIIISGRIACITWKRPIANMSHVLWSVCLCVRYRSGTGLCKSGWTDREPVWWTVFCEPIGTTFWMRFLIGAISIEWSVRGGNAALRQVTLTTFTVTSNISAFTF